MTAPVSDARLGLSVYPAEGRARFYRAKPQRSVADPWNLAQIVGFLASDTARGTTLAADGRAALRGGLRTIEHPAYFSDFQQEAACHVA